MRSVIEVGREIVGTCSDWDLGCERRHDRCGGWKVLGERGTQIEVLTIYRSTVFHV